MPYKVKFMQNVLCTMAQSLDTLQLKELETVLVSNLHDVIMERDIFALSCEVDDNAAYLKLFIAARRIEGMSESTIKSYYYYTRNFLDMINKNFRDITAIDVQWYLSEYEVSHCVSRRSLDNIRKGINGVFIWLEENEYIDINPLHRVHPIAYEEKPIQILSDYDIVKIRDYVHDKPRERAMVEFLLSTGVRVSELCSIDIKDVILDSGEVAIHCAKKRRKKDRIAFLTPEAIYSIQNYQNWRYKKRFTSCEALFQSNRTCGTRITERIVNITLRGIEKRLGLEVPLTCHVFRKTLASQLHRRGMQNLDVATLLGHVDSRTSEKYYIGVHIDDLKREFIKYR